MLYNIMFYLILNIYVYIIEIGIPNIIYLFIYIIWLIFSLMTVITPRLTALALYRKPSLC